MIRSFYNKAPYKPWWWQSRAKGATTPLKSRLASIVKHVGQKSDVNCVTFSNFYRFAAKACKQCLQAVSASGESSGTLPGLRSSLNSTGRLLSPRLFGLLASE